VRFQLSTKVVQNRCTRNILPTDHLQWRQLRVPCLDRIVRRCRPICHLCLYFYSAATFHMPMSSASESWRHPICDYVLVSSDRHFFMGNCEMIQPTAEETSDLVVPSIRLIKDSGLEEATPLVSTIMKRLALTSRSSLGKKWLFHVSTAASVSHIST